MSHPLVETALAGARDRLAPVREGGAYFVTVLEKFAARPEFAGFEPHVASLIERAAIWAIEAYEAPAGPGSSRLESFYLS